MMIALIGAGAQSRSASDAEEARVMRLENAWSQAIQLKDVKALGPLFAEEAVYIDVDGSKMNKKQYLASVESPAFLTDHIMNEFMLARSYGTSMVVTGISQEKGMKYGKPFALRLRFVDTWIRRNGAWLCVASQATPLL